MSHETLEQRQPPPLIRHRSLRPSDHLAPALSRRVPSIGARPRSSRRPPPRLSPRPPSRLASARVQSSGAGRTVAAVHRTPVRAWKRTAGARRAIGGGHCPRALARAAAGARGSMSRSVPLHCSRSQSSSSSTRRIMSSPRSAPGTRISPTRASRAQERAETLAAQRHDVMPARFHDELARREVGSGPCMTCGWRSRARCGSRRCR